jgi:hypothetical protein
LDSVFTARDPSPSLSWEVKGSFRDYVIGVGGMIELTAPASDCGPTYRFPLAPSPELPGLDEPGLMKYSGAVRFNAHQGLMDLVIEDPWIHRAGGLTRLSIAANATQPGAAGNRLVIADLGTVSPTRSGRIRVWACVPAKLTTEGASAFGFNYSPGTELAAITFSHPA